MAEKHFGKIGVKSSIDIGEMYLRHVGDLRQSERDSACRCTANRIVYNTSACKKRERS
ncbi:MAG: hypothetical protein ACR2O4_15700 [Hyphomicrobiaceae bacterium]